MNDRNLFFNDICKTHFSKIQIYFIFLRTKHIAACERKQHTVSIVLWNEMLIWPYSCKCLSDLPKSPQALQSHSWHLSEWQDSNCQESTQATFYLANGIHTVSVSRCVGEFVVQGASYILKQYNWHWHLLFRHQVSVMICILAVTNSPMYRFSNVSLM